MKERTALILVFVAMAVALTGSFVALRLLDAGDQAFVLPYIVVVCVGAATSSRVVIHYADKRSAERDGR